MLARLSLTAAALFAFVVLIVVYWTTEPTPRPEDGAGESESRDGRAPSPSAPLVAHDEVVKEGSPKRAVVEPPLSLVRAPIGEQAPRDYFFANAQVLESRVDAWYSDGSFKRTKIVRHEFKYSHIRIEETVRPNREEGREEIVDFVAMVADHMIVEASDVQSLRRLNANHGYSIRANLKTENTYLVAFDECHLDTLDAAVSSYEGAPSIVAIAEPDYMVFTADWEDGELDEGEEALDVDDVDWDAESIEDEGSPSFDGPQVDGDYSVDTTPDDVQFDSLWGLSKIGAPNAWNLTTGSEAVVVAVIDTGIDYEHPDLAANCWVNSDEIADNAIDDDGNGFVDDVYGYDFYHGDGDPQDDHHHGTHCAGIIGAVGNNGEGIVGVAWAVKLMALKFLGPNGGGVTSDAIQAIDYATKNGADITNNSWGGGRSSRALRNAIRRGAERKSIPFIAAAGNNARDNDDSPHFPSSYPIGCIISVGSTTSSDKRSAFSNFGRRSVDLAAPGTDILSTVPRDKGDYRSLSGTSMATPYVAGAAALLKSSSPTATFSRIKRWLLTTVDKLAVLRGRCTTRGRLNITKAVAAVPRLRMGSFSATDNIYLSWTLPTAVAEPSDTVYITRRTDTYPSMYSFGEQVYSGTGENGSLAYEDKWLTPGSAYYYRIWVDDGNGNVVDPIAGSVDRISGTPDAGTHRLFWRDARGTVSLWALASDGTRKGTTSVRRRPASKKWAIRGAGDLNGDGFADLYWRKNDGDVLCWIVKGDGTSNETIVVAENVALSWTLEQVGDVDGNGTPDLVWRTNRGVMMIWFVDDQGQVTSKRRVHPKPLNRKTSLVGAGDLDGDGFMDLVFKRPDRRIETWLLRSTGTRRKVTAVDSAKMSNLWSMKGVADVNADGRDDLVWRHGRNGRVLIWFIDENGQMDTAVVAKADTLDATWTLGSVGDIDASGNADLVFVGPDGEVQYWLLGTDGLYQSGGNVIETTVPKSWGVKASSY